MGTGQLTKKLVAILVCEILIILGLLFCSDNEIPEQETKDQNTKNQEIEIQETKIQCSDGKFLKSIKEKFRNLRTKYSELSSCTNDSECKLTANAEEDPCYCNSCGGSISIRGDLENMFQQEREDLVEECRNYKKILIPRDCPRLSCPIASCAYIIEAPKCSEGRCVIVIEYQR